MKKSPEKLSNPSLKKDKKNKLSLNKARFSTYQEDFVITEQEEREGGFSSSYNKQMISTLKYNK